MSSSDILVEGKSVVLICETDPLTGPVAFHHPNKITVASCTKVGSSCIPNANYVLKQVVDKGKTFLIIESYSEKTDSSRWHCDMKIPNCKVPGPIPKEVKKNTGDRW